MRSVSESVLASGFAVVALILSNGFLLTFQQDRLTEVPFHSPAICLVHGVVVVCAWLAGWRSVALLLPGVLFGNFVLSGIAAFAPSAVALQLALLASAPLAFSIFAWAGIDARKDQRWARNWRLILVVGGVASAIYAVASHAIRFNEIPLEYHLLGVVHEIGAGIGGLAIVMTLGMFFFRYVRLAPRILH